MNEILDFIARHMDYLGERGFRETASTVTTHDGGASLLVLESGNLRLRFTRDRGQLFVDLQPAGVPASGEWFSVDLIRRLYLGAPERSAVLDESYADFLRERIDDVDARFAPTAWPGTRTELVRLKRTRSHEMFGSTRRPESSVPGPEEGRRRGGGAGFG